MIFNSRCLVLLIALSSFFSPAVTTGDVKSITHSQLSEQSTFNENCDKGGIFPKPPCCGVSNQLPDHTDFGHRTALNEFPWVVYVDFGAGAFSGGSLINAHWVLAAAHSFNHAWKKIQVRLGEWNTLRDPDCDEEFCKPKVKIIQVEKVIVHEHYDKLVSHDIALLHLAETVCFSDYVKPICLPMSDASAKFNYADKMAIAAGWGIIESGRPSNLLLKAKLKIWNAVSCNQYANVSMQICAIGVGKVGTSTGNSGGPLMLQMQNSLEDFETTYQIGVISYGINDCGASICPKVFTRLSAYKNWINDTIIKYQ